MSTTGRRIAILAGARTPFCRAGGQLARVPAATLGAIAAREALLRAGVAPDRLDQVIFGMVSLPVGAPNVARDVGLQAGFAATVPAYTVSRACISANQAITSAADQIALGRADVIVAGGVETLSDVPIVYGREFRDALVRASKARSFGDRLGAFAGVRPRDLAPVAPAIAEPSTGLTMGQSAEKMAKAFSIARTDQDAFAARSHGGAIAAWADGTLAKHVVPVPIAGSEPRLVERDDHPRADSTVEKLAALKPVFDRKHGSVTAGNASPLTDGAAAVVLASEERAKAEGWPILGFVHAYAYTAVDPFEHLLMGPVGAIARALADAKLELSQIDVVEMHEAFAAQVLANLQGLASAEYCREELGREKPVGEIDPARINPWGGSISLGHPFGATGARLVMTCLDRMARQGAEHGLVSACAAGAMGSAIVLKRA